MISRRAFLRFLGVSALTGVVQAAPRTPDRTPDDLQAALTDLIGDREIAVDIRRVDVQSGEALYRAQVNADKRYPVASCFKTWVALYYFWHMPRGAWRYEDGDPVYEMLVGSSNSATAVVLQDVADYLGGYGNALHAFNNFYVYTLGFEHGLYRWNWEGSPTEGQIDDRYAPSWSRFVEFRGQRYDMHNLTTAQALADGYALFLQPDPFPNAITAPDAFARTAELLAISAENYRAPLERVFPQGYTGKDGVIPERDSLIGLVINDAGIIQIDGATYIIAYLCMAESEVTAIETLRTIASSL